VAAVGIDSQCSGRDRESVKEMLEGREFREGGKKAWRGSERVKVVFCFWKSRYVMGSRRGG
jgi:hypothetical protein